MLDLTPQGGPPRAALRVLVQILIMLRNEKRKQSGICLNNSRRYLFMNFLAYESQSADQLR